MTNFLPDRANGTRMLGGSESEVHPRRVIVVLGLDEATLVTTPIVKRRQRQIHSLSWRAKDEQCTEQLWEKCCTCARNEQTSFTA